MWGLSLVWFLFIFGPIVRSPLGSFGDLSIFSTLFYLVWSVLNGRRLEKRMIPLCCLALFITFLAMSNSILVSETIDENSFRSILRPVKGLIVFVGLYFAISGLSRPYLEKLGPRKTYEIFLLMVYVTVVVHGLIIIFQFIIPPFRDFTYAILYDSNVLESNKAFRMPGLAGAGGAQVSAVQGLGFFIGVYLALTKRRYFPFIIGNILLVVSFLLTGRTGVVLIAIAALYWLTFILLDQKKIWQVRRPRLTVVGLLGIVAVVILVIRGVSFMSSAYEENPIFQRAVDRTFETYNNYEETGKFSDSTLQALGQMYVIPESIALLIFGDSQLYDNTSGRYQSDIGYIRLLWGYGLVGLIAHIAFYLLMGFLILQRRVRQVMGVRNVAFGIWFLIAIFVLNYKEPFFFVRMSYPISLVAIMGLYLLTRSSMVIDGVPSDRPCFSYDFREEEPST